jgi:hypothetical protein
VWRRREVGLPELEVNHLAASEVQLARGRVDRERAFDGEPTEAVGFFRCRDQGYGLVVM